MELYETSNLSFVSSKSADNLIFCRCSHNNNNNKYNNNNFQKGLKNKFGKLFEKMKPS